MQIEGLSAYRVGASVDPGTNDLHFHSFANGRDGPVLVLRGEGSIRSEVKDHCEQSEDPQPYSRHR